MQKDENSAQQAIQNAMQALQRGDQATAHLWAERAASLAPHLEQPWLILAAVSSPRASIAYLEKALQINPESSQAKQALSWARKKLEQSTPHSDPIDPKRGIGLAASRKSGNTAIKFLAVPIGFSVAVFTHAFHNTFSGFVGGFGGFLAGTAVDYLGYAFMLGFIVWMIIHERNILKVHLQEEVEKGYLSTGQYHSALSFFQLNAYLSALTSGSFLKTARFYQVCGELAHKKEQFTRLGDERGNIRIIEKLRSELLALSPVAKA